MIQRRYLSHLQHYTLETTSPITGKVVLYIQQRLGLFAEQRPGFKSNVELIQMEIIFLFGYASHSLRYFSNSALSSLRCW